MAETHRANAKAAQKLGMNPLTLNEWCRLGWFPAKKVVSGKKSWWVPDADAVNAAARRNRSAVLVKIKGRETELLNEHSLVPFEFAHIVSGLSREDVFRRFHRGELDWVTSPAGSFFPSEQLERLGGEKARILHRNVAEIFYVPKRTLARWAQYGWLPSGKAQIDPHNVIIHYPAREIRALASSNMSHLAERFGYAWAKKRTLGIEHVRDTMPIPFGFALRAWWRGELRWVPSLRGPRFYAEDLEKLKQFHASLSDFA
ncbi:Uncharacterised protein [Candidatus Norongarragalina meridionalis]|nr:Uncharacterised protein [Candidatus Norongarragalina meridionalis]